MKQWKDLTTEEKIALFEEQQRKYEERCLICARCEKNTGNTTQGHWWAWCKVTKATKEHHFCCPGDCELQQEVHNESE